MGASVEPASSLAGAARRASLVLVSANNKVCCERCFPTSPRSAAAAPLHVDFSFKAELQFNQPSAFRRAE